MSDGSPNSRDRVFEFIVRYKREHDGLSPAIRDIAEGCVLHESTVRYHLMRLEIEDRIRVLGRRAIEVTGGVWDLPPDEVPDAASDDAAPDREHDSPPDAPESPPDAPGGDSDPHNHEAGKRG